MNKSADAYLKFLLENTSDPVLVFNRKMLQVTDYNSAAEIFLPDNERNLVNLFSEELVTCIKAGMRYVYLKQISKNIADSGGEVCISEAKETYESGILLFKSDTINFSKLLSEVKTPVCVFDDNGKVVFWNERSVKDYGYSKKEIIGKTADNLYHLLAPYSEVKTKLISFPEGINEFKTKSGKQVFMECSTSRIKNFSGVFSGNLCLMRDVSDKILLDEELFYTKKERDIILNNISESITVHDQRGRIVYANSISAKSVGLSSSRELMNLSFSDILTKFEIADENGKLLKPEDLPGYRALKGERNPNCTVRFRNPISGEEEYAVISANPVFDKNNDVKYSVNIIFNVSNLKKAQKELQLSESRFRMIFEQSPLIIQIFNSDGDLVKYNKSFITAWNITEEVPSNYNLFRDYTLKESEFQVHLDKVLKGEFSEIPPIKFSQEFTGENYIWMRGFIYPVKNEDNSIREIVLILENISDQKQMEESFGIESSYRSAIESSVSAGIAVVDLNGKQTYVNDAFCRMVGWSKEELMGMYPPFIYWAAENKSKIEEAFSQTIKGEFPVNGYELKFKNKKNEVFDVMVTINPLRDSQEKTVGWLASVSDISQLKKVEDEMKQSLREKEVLLKEIHHRVKNNLQIISSLLNLQLNYIQNKEMQAIFKESQNRVMSMALIHQKLYLSKNQVYIDLHEYISELIQHLLKSYSVNKEIDVDVQVQNVFLDNDKVVLLGLIVNELISNALQYAFHDMRKGNIKVHMRETRTGVSLLIKDNGKGFPENINYKKTKSLGLQLVNSLVDQLGGNIKLRQNEGTEFDISFNSGKRFN